MEIKPIAQDELAAVQKLVTEVFMEFEAPDYTRQGVQTFFDTALYNPEFMQSLDILGAFSSGTLVGILATRDSGKHIALFFVDGKHHRKGIGKQLFQTLLTFSSAGEISVNSSPYAKEAYHRLGFRDTGAEKTISGIRFIPMIFSVQ